jgi:5'-nucleotidase
MNRRNFVKKIAFGTSGFLVSNALISSTFSNSKKNKLVILHTNDTHSNIETFPLNHPKFPGMGGVAKRFSLIQQIRAENEHVLLLDSGDIFQGTPYFNTYNGELELKLMSKMGYDAATMGNHDFDIGLDGFLNAKKHANFPFLCSNYDFSKTILKDETLPYKVFKKGGIKIGVFGLGIDLNGLVPTDKFGATRYNDPIETANKIAQELKDLACDLVICLSHLGYQYEDKSKPSDVLLAEKVSGIDLILGGHTHTFMQAPTKVTQPDGHTVWIHQVGWAGVRLGAIEVSEHKINFLQKIIQ